MKYRLGVDLGTSSIGIAAFSLTDNDEIDNLIYLDSYIFEEPIVPKENITTNSKRRSARLMRRQTKRKSKRLKKISYIANSIGINLTKEDFDKTSDKIHEFRAKAISEKTELTDLIKVFAHIVKNRGYKGDLKRADGEVSKKVKETKEMFGDMKTLGQVLYEKKLATQNNEPWHKLNQDGTFILRNDIENEFELIWAEQIKHHKELQGDYKNRETIDQKTGEKYFMFQDHANKESIFLHDAFKSAMFYQRPIKWRLETIGDCSLESDEKRAASCQISFQQFRLAAQIINLRIKTKDKLDRQLSQEEIKKVYDFVSQNFGKYDDRNKISYKSIYKELNLIEGERFSIDRNTSSEKENGLKGISTLKAFYDLDKINFEFINAFNSLSEKSQELVMEFLANITKYSDIQDNPESYIDIAFTDKNKSLIKNIKDAPNNDILSAINFVKLLRSKEAFYDLDLEQGRASYSVKALNRILPKLLEGKDEATVILELYPKKTDNNMGVLKEYNKVATNNPVTDKALREFERTLKYVIKKFGSNPQEITIEMTRELKSSLTRRKFLEDQSKKRTDEKSKAINELKENNIAPTSEMQEKYLLWLEQDNICPYCGQKISLEQFANKTQIDHIIPRSIGGPNIFANKILAHTKCNHEKGEKIPYEWKFKDDIDEYLAFIKVLSEKKKNKKKEENKNDKQSSQRLEFGNHSSLINLVKSLWQKYGKEKKGYFDQHKRKFMPTRKGRIILDKINFILCKPDEVKEMIGEFSDLHLNSTAWINTIILDWCKDICPKVSPSFGGLTAYLRNKLHFDDILPLIRVSKEQKLYDENNKEIDANKWKELYLGIPANNGDSDEQKHYFESLTFSNTNALKDDFEKYLNELPKDKKPLNDTDKQKLFKEFCKEERQFYKFNKRSDYRHHAVDAALIGLSTFSIIQRASEHNRRYGGLEAIKDAEGNIKIEGFKLEPKNYALFKEIKEQTQKYLTDYVVYHKPDHFPSGKFFEETAYNVKEAEGKKGIEKRFAISESLEKILGKETDEKEFITKLEEVIVGESIKNEIIKQVKERLAKGQSLEEAFLKNDLIYRGNKIKKIKVFFKRSGFRIFKDDSDKSINGKKYYQNNDYACMDFDKNTGELVCGIPLWKFNRADTVKENIIRFFKNDIIFDKETNEFYKVTNFRVAKGSMGINPVSESLANEKSIKNVKNLILCKTRSDIAKIKKEIKENK